MDVIDERPLGGRDPQQIGFTLDPRPPRAFLGRGSTDGGFDRRVFWRGQEETRVRSPPTEARAKNLIKAAKRRGDEVGISFRTSALYR